MFLVGLLGLLSQLDWDVSDDYLWLWILEQRSLDQVLDPPLRFVSVWLPSVTGEGDLYCFLVQGQGFSILQFLISVGILKRRLIACSISDLF